MNFPRVRAAGSEVASGEASSKLSSFTPFAFSPPRVDSNGRRACLHIRRVSPRFRSAHTRAYACERRQRCNEVVKRVRALA